MAYAARIDPVTGIVKNVEMVGEVWPSDDSGDLFIEYTDAQPACIGYGWTPENGFDQPPPVVVPNAPAL